MENIKSFDPRVNRLTAVNKDVKVLEGESWEPYEVFHQKKRGDTHIHVGSVRAGNSAQALLFAKEQYGRRQLCSNMWVVKTGDIYSFTYEDADIFETAVDKEYREAFGFKVRDKINAYKKGLT
jgi:ring-1,2-phenylacetyl-CoA epoxidase subunit PaaB